MQNGWIKLHRKIKDKGWYKHSDYVHVWVHILLEANHKGKEFFWGGETVKLKPGQLVTGRKSISAATGVSESKVQRILKCFESEQQIEQQTNNRFRLITVLKWTDYQIDEQQNEQQMNNQRTTGEQLVNTNKNVKNVKNEKKLLAATSAADIKKVFEKFQMTINPTINYGNKTQRKAAEGLIKKLGLERTLSLIEYCYEIRNDKFAPVVTTPYQLQEKLAHVASYWNKDNNKPDNVVSI